MEKMLFYCLTVCIYIVSSYIYIFIGYVVIWLENACFCRKWVCWARLGSLREANVNDLRGSTHRSFLICMLFVYMNVYSVSASEVRRSRTKMDNYKHFVWLLSDTLEIAWMLSNTRSHFSKSWLKMQQDVWLVRLRCDFSSRYIECGLLLLLVSLPSLWTLNKQYTHTWTTSLPENTRAYDIRNTLARDVNAVAMHFK